VTPRPVRVFVAVRLGAALSGALGGEVERLRPAAPRVTWVSAANLHLTLKFLGEVAVDALPPVGQALAALAARTPPFDLVVAGLGAFPSLARPRVVWAGVPVGQAAMRALALAVEGALAPLGFPPEARPFSPHVTLGRAREARPNPRLAAALADTGAPALGRVRVDTVWLMRSDLCRAGARYAEIGQYPFAGAESGAEPT
jgi:RNA 2',3'-cyclic 3'-phosphodiesterase